VGEAMNGENVLIAHSVEQGHGRSLAHKLLLYARVFGVQLKNNWVREAVYRVNFLTMMATDVVWIAVEFSLFSVIYANTTVLAGWRQEQVFFFLGIFFASDAIFTIFFQRNFWTFSDLVNKGELDILLTKPVHPLFLSLTRWISLTAVFNVVLGFAIAIRFAKPAGFVGGWHWLLVIFWLLVGTATQLLVRFAFSIWIFWTERSFALSRLYFQFFAFATKPDSLYPKMIRYLILTALPFAFISSVPTRALLHGLHPKEYLNVAAVLLAFWGADTVLWRFGLKRYQSASS
jgi:ABC-2 type transport system permease protein